ncbi:hypothetical protein [Elstera litoralis]|uniref:hypothetical protein n=1 Tax=Elstera litoralis TaxID=552518 RepID=UPI001E2DF8B7|nr:hypothetical protein [Elstera litoralis]
MRFTARTNARADRNGQDACKVAAHIDLKRAILRDQDDLLHQRADNLCRCHTLAVRILLKRRVQFGHLNPVMVRHIRMQQGRRLLCFLQECLQLPLTSL